MGPASLASYLLGALGYAALAASGLLLLLRMAGVRPTLGRAALALSAAFVVFLALSPFPDPADLDCTDGGVAIQTGIFGFREAPQRLWASGAPLGAWLTDLTITSTIMNVVFFALVGAALATQTLRIGSAFLFGLALTLGIETLQFTGNLGLYPCRYRTVDIDDVVLNVAGVVLGVAAMRRWRCRSAA
jgi:hypothetical protein